MLLEAEELDKQLQQELKKYSDSDPTLLEGQSKRMDCEMRIKTQIPVRVCTDPSS
jgi:hypothetical protein